MTRPAVHRRTALIVTRPQGPQESQKFYKPNNKPWRKLHLHNHCYVGILLDVNQKITHSLQMLSSISSSSVKLLVNHNKRSASKKQTFNLSFFVTSHYYKRSAKIDGHAVTLKC